MLLLVVCAHAITGRPFSSPPSSPAHLLVISQHHLLPCQHNNLNAGPLLPVAYCQPTESNLSFRRHIKEDDPIHISAPFNMCGRLTFAFHLSGSHGEKKHCKSLLCYSPSMAEHRMTTTEMKCKAGTEQIEAFCLLQSGVTSTCMADNR